MLDVLLFCSINLIRIFTDRNTHAFSSFFMHHARKYKWWKKISDAKSIKKWDKIWITINIKSERKEIQIHIFLSNFCNIFRHVKNYFDWSLIPGWVYDKQLRKWTSITPPLKPSSNNTKKEIISSKENRKMSQGRSSGPTTPEGTIQKELVKKIS